MHQLLIGIACLCLVSATCRAVQVSVSVRKAPSPQIVFRMPTGFLGCLLLRYRPAGVRWNRLGESSPTLYDTCLPHVCIHVHKCLCALRSLRLSFWLGNKQFTRLNSGSKMHQSLWHVSNPSFALSAEDVVR